MPPAEFWDQTRATYQAIMLGARDRDTALAWHIAALSRADKLRPLRRYLSAAPPKPMQTHSEVLARMERLKRSGFAMTITRIKQDGR